MAGSRGYLSAEGEPCLDGRIDRGMQPRVGSRTKSTAHLESLASMRAAFVEYGVSETESAPVIASLRRNPDEWVRFMMRFELGLEEPHPNRALKSAATIAASYVIGGAIPLSAYFVAKDVTTALHWSVGITLTALTIFGYFKGYFTGTSRMRSAGQTLVVGGVAAAAAFELAKLVSER